MTQDEQLMIVLRSWGRDRLLALVNGGQRGWLGKLAKDVLNEQNPPKA